MFRPRGGVCGGRGGCLGCLLTCASVDRRDGGAADEDDHGRRPPGVLQTALDEHDRCRQDFPPQLLAAGCRQRHHAVNWGRDGNQSAFPSVPPGARLGNGSSRTFVALRVVGRFSNAQDGVFQQVAVDVPQRQWS